MSLKDVIMSAIRGENHHRDSWLDPEDMMGIYADLMKIEIFAKMVEIHEEMTKKFEGLICADEDDEETSS